MSETLKKGIPFFPPCSFSGKPIPECVSPISPSLRFSQVYIIEVMCPSVITWEKRKLESIFKERTERSSEGTMLSVTINDGVVLANSLSRKNVSSSDKSNYKLVRKDDIAYNSMRMWQSASGVSNYEGIVSPAYTVLIPEHDVNSSFFGYYFKRTVMKQVFQKNSQGLTSDTWNLKYPLLKNIVVQIPSIEEQIKISEFLKQVDKLIAVNQRISKFIAFDQTGTLSL